jgi:hypothetical protein
MISIPGLFSCDRPYPLCAAAVFSALTVQPAVSDTLSDTHIFGLGYYDQEVDISAAATVKPQPKVELDFDRALGLDESADTFFAAYQWRFKEKWSLQLMYAKMSADGNRSADRDFTWDGEEYTFGTRIKTDFELDTLLSSVRYAFIRDERKELGLGFGLHAFDIKTTLEINADIDEDSQRGSRTNTELLAPLPNLAAFGHYLISDNWSVSGSLAWLSINYDEYDGDYTLLNLITEYRFTDRFGVGFSYQWSNIDVERKKSRKTTSFDIDTYGPSIYLVYGF